MMLDLSLVMLLRVLDGYIGCGNPNDGHQTRSLSRRLKRALGPLSKDVESLVSNPSLQDGIGT